MKIRIVIPHQFCIWLLGILLALAACQPSDNNNSPEINLSSTPTLSTTIPRVLVLTPEQYAIGGNTLLDTFIQQAGGINAAHDLEDFRQISDTQILELQPDIILFTQAWTDGQIAVWSQIETYATLPAVQNGNLYRLDFSTAEADLRQNEVARVDTLRTIIQNAQ
jgi:ABC-type Fe3+-hydroxamate transport system substrate-binding protein